MKLNKILLYLNLFFLQAYLIRFQIGSYPTNLQEILITAQILIFLYAVIQAKSFIQTIKNLKKHWIILSLILLTGLSVALVPTENKLDFFRHLKFLFFATVTTFIFMETFKNAEEKRYALKIAGYGAIAFGIFSVIYNLSGHNVAPDSRLLGPLDAAVYLAYYLTPFFIFFVIETLENPKINMRQSREVSPRANKMSEAKTISNLLSALILGILILATQSMGAIGGSLLIILLYLFKNSELKILKNKITKISLAAILLIVSIATFYGKILPAIETKYSSLNERGEIWQTSKKLLKKPENAILGVGFGQFQQQYFDNVETAIGRKPLDFYVLQPHNIFLLFIFNFGILGLIFILFCIYKNMRNLITQKKDFLLTVNFILLYFFLHGLIDTPFFKNDLLILFILFLELGLPAPPWRGLFKPTNQSHQD